MISLDYVPDVPDCDNNDFDDVCEKLDHYADEADNYIDQYLEELHEND